MLPAHGKFPGGIIELREGNPYCHVRDCLEVVYEGKKAGINCVVDANSSNWETTHRQIYNSDETIHCGPSPERIPRKSRGTASTSDYSASPKMFLSVVTHALCNVI